MEDDGMQTPRTELQQEHHHSLQTEDVINSARSRCIAPQSVS
jgi:hypothetical protein